MTCAINGTVTDLATGDRLLYLAGVGFAELADPDAPPVLVADVRPAADMDTDQLCEVVTSIGTLYAAATDPARATRDDTVTIGTVLLISRRAALHATLTALGTPVVHRTPVEPGTSTTKVTADEWHRAPLIVIDGYLAASTLRTMWSRGDLSDRDQIVMVCTDPDDPRAETRLTAAHARHLLILPHDEPVLRSLFAAATNPHSGERHPFPGILTPRA